MKNEKMRETQLRKAKEELQFYNNLRQARQPAAVQDGLKILEEQRPVNLENIKDSCLVELQRFISQRGSIDKDTGKVNIKFMSVSESNKTSTIKKIEEAQALIQDIKQTDSVEALRDLLQHISTPASDLSVVVDRCLDITNSAGELDLKYV